MSTNLLIRRLYRSLLKASKPFTSPSPNAVVLSCLLHRSFTRSYDDVDDVGSSSGGGSSSKVFVDGISVSENNDGATAQSSSEEEEASSHRVLYSQLLRNLFSNKGDTNKRYLLFPHHVEESTTKLRDMIRREFRADDYCISSKFDVSTRRQVAFLALRELNKKTAWAEQLLRDGGGEKGDNDEQQQQQQQQLQAARHVSRLPARRPLESYVKPGTYLLAHPLMKCFFHQSVVFLINGGTDAGAYGLVVNRVTANTRTGEHLSLRQVLRTVPTELDEAFGSSLVKTGGPVHEAFQMLHLCSPEQEELGVGGKVLSMVPEEEDDDDADADADESTTTNTTPTTPTSTALHSDRAVYYEGDILKAAQAVVKGQMDRDDVSIFVGFSCWSPGQLEREIEQGCWLPCRGPPEIAHSGSCEHLPPTEEGTPRPEADLWLSMMSACGKDEAKLAHLLRKSERSEYGGACDDFDRL